MVLLCIICIGYKLPHDYHYMQGVDAETKLICDAMQGGIGSEFDKRKYEKCIGKLQEWKSLPVDQTPLSAKKQKEMLELAYGWHRQQREMWPDRYYPEGRCGIDKAC